MSPAPVGLAAGMSAWPMERYGTGLLTGTMRSSSPSSLVSTLKTCAAAGIRLFIAFPRNRMTTNGENVGRFSTDKAKALVADYKKVLTPTVVQTYRNTLLAFILCDDMASTKAWGGRVIQPEELAPVFLLAKSLDLGFPRGLRTVPSYWKNNLDLVKTVELGVAQWHAKKGDQSKYYDQARADASHVGCKMAYTVNVGDINGVGTGYATPDDIRQRCLYAVNYPGNRAMICWKWNKQNWDGSSGVRAAWQEVVAAAKAKPFTDCR